MELKKYRSSFPLSFLHFLSYFSIGNREREREREREIVKEKLPIYYIYLLVSVFRVCVLVCARTDRLVGISSELEKV